MQYSHQNVTLKYTYVHKKADVGTFVVYNTGCGGGDLKTEIQSSFLQYNFTVDSTILACFNV